MASRNKWQALFVVVACLVFTGAAAGRSQVRLAPGARLAATSVARVHAQLTAGSVLGALSATRALRVAGQGFSPHAAVVVTQCSTGALAAALQAVSSALDYCDEHFVAVTASGADGSFVVRARATPTIHTASGPVDCRRRNACLLGALNLSALQHQPLQVAVLPLAFAPSARVAPSPVSQKRLLSETYGTPPLTVGKPSRTALIAYPAGRLGPERVGQVPSVPAGGLPRAGHRVRG